MRYLCYISKERVDELFETAFEHLVDTVDVTKGSETNMSAEVGLSAVLTWLKAGLMFGQKKSSATLTRARLTAVGRLTDVLRYIEHSAQTADLNENLDSGKPLPQADWYSFHTELTVKSWQPDSPAVELFGYIGGWEIRLSCRARDFSGMYEEAGHLIPTSTNYYLFNGEVALPMGGLIRLISISPKEKLLRGSALFLVLNPLEIDLGEKANVAL